MTERANIEEALRLAENQADAAMSAPDRLRFVTAYDDDGVLVYTLSRGGLLSKLGLSNDDVVGRPVLPDVPEEHRLLFEQVATGEVIRPVAFESNYPAVDGSTFPCRTVLRRNAVSGVVYGESYDLSGSPTDAHVPGGDTKAGMVREVFRGLFGGIDGLRNGGAATWVKTMGLLFMSGFTVFWVFAAAWGQSAETMSAFLDGTAKVVEAAASVVPDQLTTIQEQTVQLPPDDVDSMSVDADNVEVRPSPSQPRPPAP